MILALLLSLGAAQAGPSVPPWPISPDGERVAVREGELEVEGGALARESDRVWVVTPAPGRATLSLRGGGDAVTVPVGPAEGRIRVAFDPPAPVKGRDARVRIRLSVTDPGGASLAVDRPLVAASTGRLGPLSPTDAPGVFEADWLPSDSPRPEVLGIVAVVPRCPLCPTPLASGGASLPVAAAIDLPGSSDPGVLTRVEVAGRSWGPVRADANGRFSVPVVVPPGTRWAHARSQSALGNERRSTLDLHLDDSPGVACAAWPGRAAVDGASEVGLTCVGWNGAGAAVDPSPLRSSAEVGQVGPARVADGLWRARYRPPRGRLAKEVLRVAWPGRGAPAVLPLDLVPGPPVAIEWRSAGEPAPPAAWLEVVARAVDEWGNALGTATLDGAPLTEDRLKVREALGDGVQRVHLAWSAPAGTRPERLALARDGGSWVAVASDVAWRPVPGVTLRFGGGQTAVTDAAGEARIPARGEREVVEGPEGLRAVAWDFDRSALPTRRLARDVGITLRPPGSVDVEAWIDGGWVRWRVRGADGASLPGRAVRVRGDGVVLGTVEGADGGGRCALRGRGPGAVTVSDVETGATTILEVP